MQKNMSRRKFINRSVRGAAGAGIAQTVALPLLASSGCSGGETRTVHGACYHDCPDTCSWTVTTVDNKVIRFEADAENPYTNGWLCSKMQCLPDDVTFHPDRILTPLKRVGNKGAGQFEAIAWPQAIAEVSDRLKSIIAQKGGEAVLPYSFAGTQGLVQKNSISQRFFAHIGATRLERTMCGDPAVTGVMATNGQTTGVLPEDVVHSRYIVFWGTNPSVSNQHLWSLMQTAQSKGAKIVVIDPFKSDTAAQSDQHIQLIPGTDTALALAMVNVILAEGLQDQDYVERYTVGIEQLRRHVKQYNPESMAAITGLDSDTIIQLAREYANVSPALIRVLIGMEHQVNGGNAFRAVAMLPALTGAWRQHGGGLMHMTYELFDQALNWQSLGLAGTIEDPDTRSVNMVQFGKALTDTSMKPAIDALFVYNSNPAVIAPNQNLVLKGLEREDLLTVVLEHFITDTARYADYVFPATSQLEHWDLMDSWGQTYLNLNQPALVPLGQAKPNTEFFRLLAAEMGFSNDYLFESDLDIIRKTLDSDHEFLRGISFESLRQTGWAKLNLPQPWLPHAEGNFATSSGKCEFYNAAMKPPMPVYFGQEHSRRDRTRYPLQLLTVKSTKNFLNSSHANVQHLRQKEGEPFLDISEADATARSITDGDDVKVHNKGGTVLLTARISRRVKPGVVCMPQGLWPSLMNGGSSANALTDDLLTDMGNGAALQGARVQVVKI